ncbi:tetratricopeptide repeat protein [Aliiroseovarius crassostreae]|uniref:tetratricopeptide repeat protein n=1 Tax=Aliiroseovarius crassostreae TaxID=154981 RepID=UPI003C7C896B
MRNSALASILMIAMVLSGRPALAQDGPLVSLEALYAQLAEADDSNWQALEQAIQSRWAKSGSPAMDLLLERARAALEEDDLEAAFDHLGALTDHAPGFAEGWHMRATAFFRAGRLGLALEDLRRVLALEPRHFDALEGVAVVMETLDDPERAIEIYRQVLAIHPRNPDVKEALARLEQELGTTL